MVEKLKIPAHALPEYFESAKKKGLINACFELAGLNPSQFFKQGGLKESGHQGVLFELGKGVSKAVDQINYSDGEFMMAFAGSIRAYADLTNLIPFKSIDQDNPFKILTAFTKSIIENKPISLPFIMCPDVNFYEGKLNQELSENRKKEVKLLSESVNILLNHKIQPSIRLIVGNDWFHPLVRQDPDDPSSGNQEIVLKNLGSLKTYINGIADYCQVDLITDITGFMDYQIKFKQVKNKLVHDKEWVKFAKIYQAKALGKTSRYYQAINSFQIKEVAVDDIALYVATSDLLVELINQEVGEHRSASGIAFAMESDAQSLARFYLEKNLPVGLINLGINVDTN